MIQERQEARSKGIPLAPYRGLQIFDIFEDLFPNELGLFLQSRNKKLYSLFTVRQGRVQETDQVMSQIINNI